MITLKIVCVCLVFTTTSLITTINTTDDFQNQAVRIVIRIYDECQKTDGGFTPCLKKKALTFIDRVSKIDSINMGDGVKIVRNKESSSTVATAAATTPNGKSLSDNELENSLPRALEKRNEILSNMLLDKITNFLNARTVQITLPQFSSNELGRGLEEGRGKMKKMMSMMMMGMMMKMAGLIPMAMAGLFLLAGKALIISKIALLLAVIIGLKKLLSGKQDGGGGGGSGHSSGWSSGGGGGGWSSGGGGGGWDRRSIDGQQLAYKGYVKQ